MSTYATGWDAAGTTLARNDGAETLPRARAEARAILARGSKSFALAGLLLDRGSRNDAAVLYAWCRRADDRVDEVGSAFAASAVAGLRRELDEIFAGCARGPVDVALGDVIRRRRVPRAYFDALLDGFTMDVERTLYATVADLDRYAYRAAGVVGLMMCHVLGVRDDGCLRAAAHLGMAMQLTNIARDVAEDFARGRQYLPVDLVSDGELRSAMLSPAPWHPSRRRVANAVGVLLRRADGYYVSGLSGLAALGWRNALAIGAAGRIYRAIGRIIVRRRCDVIAGRAVVSLPRKLFSALAAALAVARESYARWRRPRQLARVPVITLRFEDVDDYQA